MDNIDVYNIAGEVVESFELEKKLVDAEVNSQVIHDVVVGHLANQRSGSAKTKERWEIRASTRKPWKQKGTGRARVGSVSSPIWRGGGTIFGPKPRDYGFKLSKKVRAKAFAGAIADKFRSGDVKIVSDISIAEPKTKEMVGIINKLGLEGQKLLVIISGLKDSVIKSGRNIKGVNVVQGSDVNVYEILNCAKVLIEKEALNVIKKRLAV